MVRNNVVKLDPGQTLENCAYFSSSIFKIMLINANFYILFMVWNRWNHQMIISKIATLIFQSCFYSWPKYYKKSTFHIAEYRILHN